MTQKTKSRRKVIDIEAVKEVLIPLKLLIVDLKVLVQRQEPHQLQFLTITAGSRVDHAQGLGLDHVQGPNLLNKPETEADLLHLLFKQTIE